MLAPGGASRDQRRTEPGECVQKERASPVGATEPRRKFTEDNAPATGFQKPLIR
jgi:hypothetical protein